jgi:rhodanese-related sulfurtransferase
MMPLTETGALTPGGALWIAPLLGVAFGFLLERAGLAHAPRLAGQFYFTDFTVFKVLFSALLTAMLGAFWLNRLGLLDLDRVYIPETFVLAQAIGGVLFGGGFLLSGLCPGTSCVAAASGRVDGLAVIGGILVGVFIFNVAFESIAPIYSATSLGPITFAQLLGAPTGMLITAITAIALGGFIMFGRMRRDDRAPADGAVRARALLATAATLAVGAALFDARTTAAASTTPTSSALAATTASSGRNSISAIALGERIARGDTTLHVIDLRALADYEQFHIPGAIRTTLAELATAPLPTEITLVLYDDTGASAVQGQALLQRRGFPSVLVLHGGLYEWIARVYEPRLPSDATVEEHQAFERAARLSRFFGGRPQVDVSRAEISPKKTVRTARGRGC